MLPRRCIYCDLSVAAGNQPQLVGASVKIMYTAKNRVVYITAVEQIGYYTTVAYHNATLMQNNLEGALPPCSFVHDTKLLPENNPWREMLGGPRPNPTGFALYISYHRQPVPGTIYQAPLIARTALKNVQCCMRYASTTAYLGIRELPSDETR